MFRCCSCDSEKFDDTERLGDSSDNGAATGGGGDGSGGAALYIAPGGSSADEAKTWESPQPLSEEGSVSEEATTQAPSTDTSQQSPLRTEQEERQALVKAFLKRASAGKGVPCLFCSNKTKDEFRPARIKVVANYKEFALVIGEDTPHQFLLNEAKSCLTLDQSRKANLLLPTTIESLEEGVPDCEERFVLLVYGQNNEGTVPLAFNSSREREGFTKVINVLKNLK